MTNELCFARLIKQDKRAQARTKLRPDKLYMKDADVLFVHINIMMSWQAMKQRELPCHDDEETR